MTFAPNQTVKTTGFNMTCKNVSVLVKFVEYLPVAKAIPNYKGEYTLQDCVINENGIHVIDDSNTLSCA